MPSDATRMTNLQTTAAGLSEAQPWQPIATAPYETPVEVKAGGKTFPAILKANVSLTIGERPCDQWWATTDKRPRCWTDGACWESNADENMSAQPTHWRAYLKERGE